MLACALRAPQRVCRALSAQAENNHHHATTASSLSLFLGSLVLTKIILFSNNGVESNSIKTFVVVVVVVVVVVFVVVVAVVAIAQLAINESSFQSFANAKTKQQLTIALFPLDPFRA